MKPGYDIIYQNIWTLQNVVCLNYIFLNTVHFLTTNDVSNYTTANIVAVFKLKKLKNV